MGIEPTASWMKTKHTSPSGAPPAQRRLRVMLPILRRDRAASYLLDQADTIGTFVDPVVPNRPCVWPDTSSAVTLHLTITAQLVRPDYASCEADRALSHLSNTIFRQ